MPSWPSDWIVKTLEVSGIQATSQAIDVLRAWKTSTPLPPMSNNPVGMPVHSSGAPSYLGTGYAIFPSMQAFYAAFGVFAKSSQGKTVAESFNDSQGYPAAWRAISALKWPGSATETDYPAALLDLTTEAYRASVATTTPRTRRTSGTVGGDAEAKATVMAQARAVHSALANARDAKTAARNMILKGKSNG